MLPSWDKADEEQEGMLQDPPRQRSRRWPFVGLAVAVLGIAGVGLGHAGMLPQTSRVSALDRISMVHSRIDAIIAAAVKGHSTKASVEFVVDEFASKGKPPKAMGAHAVMKGGGQGKTPKVEVTFLANPGKGKDLKEKLSKIIDLVLEMTVPKRERADIKNMIKLSVGKDTVTLEFAEAKGKIANMQKANMTAAFDEHKPEFHADVRLGRTFTEMMGRESSAGFALVAPRGIQVTLDAVFASTLFNCVSAMGPGGEEVGSMMQVVRLLKLKNDLYYTSEEEVTAAAPPHMTFKDAMDQACQSVPPRLKDLTKDLGDVLGGLGKAVLEGMSDGWQVVVDFDGVNPSPVFERCATD